MNKQPSSMLATATLLMVVFIDIMGILLVFPVLTTILLQSNQILAAGTSQAWRSCIYGLMISIFPFFMFFSTPVLGELSDRFGRKNILLLCLLGSSLGYVISVAAIHWHSLALLIFSRVLAGLSAGTQALASAAIIDQSAGKTKMRGLSWVVFVSTMGVIVGPVLGGLTAEENYSRYFNDHLPFVLAALLAFVNAILLFFFYQDSFVKTEDRRIQLTKGFGLFLSAFAQPRFRLLSFASISYFLAWSLYFQTIGWYLMKEFNYGDGKIGLFMGYVGLIGSLGLAVVLRLALLLFASEKITYLIFVLLTGVGIAGAALSSSELAQWLWVILGSAGDTICYTLILNFYSNLADERAQGWAMGVANAIGAFTWAIGGLILGPLGYFNIRAPFWVGAFLCALSFYLMLRKNNLEKVKT